MCIYKFIGFFLWLFKLCFTVIGLNNLELARRQQSNYDKQRQQHRMFATIIVLLTAR